MDANLELIIGIDGGGTGCRVAIARRDGLIIGTGKSGPANPTNKPQAALANINAAIKAAQNDASLDDDQILTAYAYAGLAGVRDRKVAKFIADGLPFHHVQVVEDRVTSVMGALAGGNGSVAPIGTGSFLARSTDQGTQCLGGWGFRLGDQASGAWLGHKLLKQVVLACEGLRDHSDLTQEILTQYNGNADGIYDFANDASPAQFGQLAPQVVDAAAQGDETAITLMQAGADYIIKGLSALGHKPQERLCLTGGLGPHYAQYLPRNYQGNLIKAKGTALDGALLLAAAMKPVKNT